MNHAARPSGPPKPAPPAARRPGLFVFVLVDALGWNLLPADGFLTDLLPYQRPLRTILGFSSGAIPTLLTGQPPSSHGHWNLLAYDPPRSRFAWLRHLAWLPDRWCENRYARRFLQWLGRYCLRAGPGFECAVSPRLLPFLVWTEERNFYRPGGLAPATSVFDLWRQSELSFRIYSYRDGWRAVPDGVLLARAADDLRRSPASAYFIYLSGLDHFLHMHRTDPAAVREQLEILATALRRLFAVAREHDPEAELSVASDHGMAPVQRNVDLVAAIRNLGYRMPEDYLAVYDSSMARFWFFAPAARQAITRRLGQLDCGRLLEGGELAAEGVLFPDQRFGEAIFLLHPGWLAATSDFHGRGWRPVGMHGYHPDDPDSAAVLLSSTPPPASLTSIAGLHDWLRRPLAARPASAPLTAAAPPPYSERSRWPQPETLRCTLETPGSLRPGFDGVPSMQRRLPGWDGVPSMQRRMVGWDGRQWTPAGARGVSTLPQVAP